MATFLSAPVRIRSVDLRACLSLLTRCTHVFLSGYVQECWPRFSFPIWQYPFFFATLAPPRVHFEPVLPFSALSARAGSFGPAPPPTPPSPHGDFAFMRRGLVALWRARSGGLPLMSAAPPCAYCLRLEDELLWSPASPGLAGLALAAVLSRPAPARYREPACSPEEKLRIRRSTPS